MGDQKSCVPEKLPLVPDEVVLLDVQEKKGGRQEEERGEEEGEGEDAATDALVVFQRLGKRSSLKA